MKCDIISLDAKKVGDIELDEAIFGVDVRNDLMARYVNWQLAKRRAGTHKTKTAAKSAAPQEAFRQKSTGRSRQARTAPPNTAVARRFSVRVPALTSTTCRRRFVVWP